MRRGNTPFSISRIWTLLVCVQTAIIRGSGDIKGILHIPGRVIFGEVECREIMPVVFDLRPFGSSKSSRWNMWSVLNNADGVPASPNGKVEPGRGNIYGCNLWTELRHWQTAAGICQKAASVKSLKSFNTYLPLSLVFRSHVSTISPMIDFTKPWYPGILSWKLRVPRLLEMLTRQFPTYVIATCANRFFHAARW